MATASTGTEINAQLPPGIYRIYASNIDSGDLGSEGVAVAPAGASVELDSADVDPESLPQGQYLTDEEDRVTILLPSKPLLPKQLWTVIPGEKGNTIIGRPTNKWPSPYLVYEGAPKKPEQGDKIIVRISDFPLNEWYLEPVQAKGHYLIRVADSKLAIGLSPLKIFPPILDLTTKEPELIWVFQYVHPIAK